jgi:Peptidase propeptide and YPEB domain
LECRLEPFLNALFICGSACAADNRPVNPVSPNCARSKSCTATPAVQRHARLARRGVCLALVLLSAAVLPAWGSDRKDHERARAAVQAGQVLPLNTVLARLQKAYPGQVLEVELEQEEGRWVYEIKLLQGSGQLLKLHVDARDGAVLDVRQRQSDRKRPSKEAGR